MWGKLFNPIVVPNISLKNLFPPMRYHLENHVTCINQWCLLNIVPHLNVVSDNGVKTRDITETNSIQQSLNLSLYQCHTWHFIHMCLEYVLKSNPFLPKETKDFNLNLSTYQSNSLKVWIEKQWCHIIDK